MSHWVSLSMLVWWILVFLLPCHNGQESKKKNKPYQLHIGAVFPMTGDWGGGMACRPAARLALEHINAQDVILPQYELVMHDRDSECLPGKGTKEMYQLLYNDTKKIVFLSGCSTVTTFIAQAAKMWNLIVLAYGSSSPALSNRARFPTFFRTHPSASIQNPTRLRLMNRWKWNKVSVLWEMEEVFTSTVQDFDEKAKIYNVTVVRREGFTKDPSIAIKNLKKSDARVILGLFYEKMARRVFCEVYRQKLYGPKIVWIIIGWYSNDWWRVNQQEVDESFMCTEEQMKEVLQCHLTTESLMWNDWTRHTDLNMTSADFMYRLKEELSKPSVDGIKQVSKQKYTLPDSFKSDSKNISLQKLFTDGTRIQGFVESPLAYDAVWALAFALDKAEKKLLANGTSLRDFTYDNKLIYQTLYNAMEKTDFIGISTSVNFDASGDRISWTRIEQMIDGEYHILGHYHFKTNNLTMVADAKWLGAQPKDEISRINQPRLLSVYLFVGMCIIGAVEIVFAVFCLIFTILLRDHWALKHSQPTMNCIFIIGCIVSICGAFLCGLDRLPTFPVLSESQFHFLCHAKIWLLSLGFTLGYGGLFSKVWLVYRQATHRKHATNAVTKSLLHKSAHKSSSLTTPTILNNTSSTTTPTTNNSNNNTAVPTDSLWEVGILLGVLLLLDCVCLIILQYWDPLQPLVVKLLDEIDPNDDDTVYIPYLNVCHCQSLTLYISLCFGWKAIFLILGLLLSYETRNVKLKFLSDSRFAGMAVYNVVILCLITAPVTQIISHQNNGLFAFIAVTVILACGISLLLLFLPKLLLLSRDGLLQSIRESVSLRMKRASQRSHTGPLPTSTEDAADSVHSTGGDQVQAVIRGAGCGELELVGLDTVQDDVTSTEQDSDNSMKARHEFLVTENEQLKQQVARCELELMELHKRLREHIQKMQEELQLKQAADGTPIDFRLDPQIHQMEELLCETGAYVRPASVKHAENRKTRVVLFPTASESLSAYNNCLRPCCGDESCEMMLESTSGVFSDCPLTNVNDLATAVGLSGEQNSTLRVRYV